MLEESIALVKMLYVTNALNFFKKFLTVVVHYFKLLLAVVHS